ncbi:hypothetical protein ACTXK0_12675 [Corynebacterium variabile]|uniref:Secreted protein n=2 Tax=Corynebacterium variabile TaxID=1727 RepID=A0A0X2NJM5_9CORY|nr:hypothetical protein [Corynebacterium variabile]AEK37720.1 putative secreted protein [Corynebacterium variabile DSM 44702]CUU64958.1 hypothetical protein CVAR292_00263 [Corynebacterium variabile]
MKKTLLTLSTVAAISIAGTGIASAAEETPTTTSGSVAGIPDEGTAGSLASLGDIAKDIKGIAGALSAVISASSDFGGVISDTQDFLGATGN